MRRPLAALTLALLAAGASAVPSQAAFFAGEAVDGPSPDVTAVGDLDIARDAGALLSYVKKEGGVDRIFVSSLADGVFGPGQRVDGGLATPSSDPVVGVADKGRGAVAFVNGGTLYTAVRPAGATAFTAPRPVAAGDVSNPTIDVAINGVTYVAFVQNGDVRVARAARDSADFTVLAETVDASPVLTAGTGPDRRPEVTTAADGKGLVVWGEEGTDGRTHAYARKIYGLRLQTTAQDLTVESFEGRAGGSADRPDVEMEDDSSYAQVVFRQAVAGSAPRALARRLRGSEFDPPVAVDGGAGTGSGGRIDLTGRGEGLFAVEGAGNEVMGSSLWENGITAFERFDSGGAGLPARPVPAAGENEDGAIAWMAGPAGEATVRGRYLEELESPAIDPEVVLSGAPVDPAGGFDAAATRRGDAFVAFVQGTGAARTIVTAVYDRTPTRPSPSVPARTRNLGTLRWGPSLDLLGTLTYSVLIDGREIGRTQGRRFTVPRGLVRPGSHRVNVLATDRRGQTQLSRTRRVRVLGARRKPARGGARRPGRRAERP